MNSKQALDHIKHMADWEYYDIKDDILPIEKDLEVLEEYRKIEEEIGIDFITLFDIISGKQKIYIEEELFKNTIWGKNWEDVKCFICKSFDYTFIYCDCWDEENFQGRRHTEVIPIKEYGKTWLLDRKDLENEKTKNI